MDGENSPKYKILQAFFSVFVGYLKTKTTVSAAEEAAWMELGKIFNAECLDHLKNLGLPH